MRERREAFRDVRLIVIASEGKDTERIYFKALAKEYTNPRVHVHILERSETEQNNSSPEHVLKQLNDYKEQYALESDDELWLVVDKDQWKDKMLSHVATACTQNNCMHIALSNPCIELWLLLHLVDATLLTPEEQQLWMENRRKSKKCRSIPEGTITSRDGFISRVILRCQNANRARRGSDRESKSVRQESC